MTWIKDEEFIRDKVPMTKFNVRVLTMAYLDLQEEEKFLDIGAGTGSISVQGAKLGAKVTAIENNELGVDLIIKNSEKFNLNIEVIKGMAPKDLPNKTFDKIFVGGSKGKLKEIFNYLDKNLVSKGTVVANFITLKNAHEFLSLLEEKGYKSIEVELVQTSSMDKIGLLRGENPIFIIKGVKE